MVRILVCSPKLFWMTGGAERLCQEIVRRLHAAGCDVDTVAMPFRSWPHTAALQSALLWRWLEIPADGATGVDCVLAMKAPAYLIRHPRKVVWLIHQFREVYEFADTPYSGYGCDRPDSIQLMRWYVEADRQALNEAVALWTISANVRRRLQRYLDLDAEVVYPPPPRADRFYCVDYEPAVLVVQRLEPHKRTALLIQSLLHVRGDYQLWLVGRGSESDRIRAMLRAYHLQERVRWYPDASEDTLLQLYARCRCVFYGPYDEDYGFVPLEAFLAHKPVITTTDSGGPLEFVRHGENGWVCSPEPRAIASAIQIMLDDADLAQHLGENGNTVAAAIRWEPIVQRLQAIARSVE